MLVRTYNEHIAKLTKSIKGLSESNPRDTLLAIDLSNVTKNINMERKLSSTAASRIKEIFLIRENEIVIPLYSYISEVPATIAVNQPWLILAKKLCEGGVFKFHYYQLLYSTAKNINGMDYIQMEPIVKLGLRDLFYSSNKQMLLSLKSGLQCAAANHGKMGFYILDDSDERKNISYWYELDADELHQLSVTNRRYYMQLTELKKKKENCDEGKNLSFITVFVLNLMIECSFFDSGVNGKYTSSQRDKAEEAYKAFLSFLTNITEQERNFLMAQIIYNEGRGELFEHLWSAATLGAMCVTWANQNIASLVLDYESEHRFINRALQRFFPDRRAKKTYSENPPFEIKQQIISITILMDSLISTALDSTKKNALRTYCLEIESETTTMESCLSFTKSCMNLFNTKLNEISEEGLSDNASMIQRTLLKKISLLSPNKAQRVICYQLIMYQFAQGGTLNFFEQLPDICKRTLFPLKANKIAFGFLIIKQFQDLGEPPESLQRHIHTLFQLLCQSRDTDIISEVELNISELINVFITTANRKSAEVIKTLVGKVAELDETSTRETIILAGFDKLIRTICSINNSPYLNEPIYKDKNVKEVGLVKLKLGLLDKFKDLRLDDCSSVIPDSLSYLCSISEYSFQQANIDQANEFVTEITCNKRQRTSSFDL